MRPCMYIPRMFFLGFYVPRAMRPLDDASLGLFVPDRCVPTLERIQALDKKQQLLAETFITITCLASGLYSPDITYPSITSTPH
jgi:hypothetical protein